MYLGRIALNVQQKLQVPDFQLFMALLDGDRFEGRFRDGVHQVEISDLMRRMVKENLLKFDGTPLFPERIAKTVPYRLSDAEARLYREVPDYACARSLIGPRHSPTINEQVRLGLHSPSYNADSHPLPRPFTSPCTGAANACKSACGNSSRYTYPLFPDKFNISGSVKKPMSLIDAN
jgi:hypothetical protein